MSEDLVYRLRQWNDDYGDDKFPLEGEGDAVWLAEGAALLNAVRESLAPSVQIVATEPWWGEAAAK